MKDRFDAIASWSCAVGSEVAAQVEKRWKTESDRNLALGAIVAQLFRTLAHYLPPARLLALMEGLITKEAGGGRSDIEVTLTMKRVVSLRLEKDT